MSSHFETSTQKLLDGFCAYLKDRAMSDLTQHCYCADIKKFQIEHPDLLNVNDEQVRDYLAKIDVKPTTLNRKISSLRTFYKWASKHSGIVNPTLTLKTVKTVQTERQFIPDDDINKLFDQIKAKSEAAWIEFRDKAIYSLLLKSGVRVGDISLISWKDIDFVAMQVSVRFHRLPLSEYTRRALISYVRAYTETTKCGIPDSEPLFRNKNGGPISTRSIRRKLSTYARNAGLLVCPKNLRTTFAVKKISDGTSVGDVHKLLGHISIGSTKAYYGPQIKPVHRTQPAYNENTWQEKVTVQDHSA